MEKKKKVQELFRIYGSTCYIVSVSIVKGKKAKLSLYQTMEAIEL
jgi:hypothetical protein